MISIIENRNIISKNFIYFELFKYASHCFKKKNKNS